MQVNMSDFPRQMCGHLPHFESQILIFLLFAYLFSRSLSCVQLFAISWTIAHQALLSMGFFRQE